MTALPPDEHLTVSEVNAIREEVGVGLLDALRIARERKRDEATAAATPADDHRLIAAACKKALL